MQEVVCLEELSARDVARQPFCHGTIGIKLQQHGCHQAFYGGRSLELVRCLCQTGHVPLRGHLRGVKKVKPM